MVGFWCCCTTQGSALLINETYRSWFPNHLSQGLHQPAVFCFSSFQVSPPWGALTFSQVSAHIRWQTVPGIPQGATITKANLAFNVALSGESLVNTTTPTFGTDPTVARWKIYGEDNDTQDTSATTASDFNSLPKTTASVSFSADVGTSIFNGGTVSACNNLQTIIQEIVNRSGWTTTSKIGLIIEDNSSDNPTGYYQRVNLGPSDVTLDLEWN
tara:strand:+ start:1227 stop:1868 length:642 start_codon:yes stop_codon:yes gene_type:complete